MVRQVSVRTQERVILQLQAASKVTMRGTLRAVAEGNEKKADVVMCTPHFQDNLLPSRANAPRLFPKFHLNPKAKVGVMRNRSRTAST